MKPVVIITGASSGIGKGLVERFVKDGYRVGAIARRKELLNELAKKHNQNDKIICPVACDVTSYVSVEKAVQECINIFGTIDILVANAGINLPSSATELKIDEFEQVFNTNFFGVLYSIKAVIGQMVKQEHGHIVGISSLASYRGLPGAAPYCSSKAALSAMLESFRLDLRGTKIKVSTINPGFIKTPLTDKNLYYMPFLLETDMGVDKIYKAVLRKKEIYSFPCPMAVAVRLMRCFPVWLYDRIMKRHKNIKQK